MPGRIRSVLRPCCSASPATASAAAIAISSVTVRARTSSTPRKMPGKPSELLPGGDVVHDHDGPQAEPRLEDVEHLGRPELVAEPESVGHRLPPSRHRPPLARAAPAPGLTFSDRAGGGVPQPGALFSAGGSV
jgi:hypothetical protein